MYLIIVAQAAEITVKCRSISSNFKDEKVVSLFVLFEIEVFAFCGIVAGLWFWLTIKFLLHALFEAGPKFSFKTRGIKKATDILVRNMVDAYVTTGLFWDMAVNIYLLSRLNVVSDIIDSE